MENNTIQTVLKLKDKLTAPLNKSMKAVKKFKKSIKGLSKNMKTVGKKIGAQLKKFGKAIKSVELDTLKKILAILKIIKLFKEIFIKSFKQSGKSASSFKSKMTKSLKAVGGAIKKLGSGGFNMLKNGIGSCMSEAKKMIVTENKLVSAFKRSGKATQDEVAGLVNYSKNLEKTGVISAGVATNFQSQLAGYNLTADSVKSLSADAMDLVASLKGVNATQADGAEVGDMLGSALNGQTDALKEVGINFTKAQEDILKYGTEQEKVKALSEAIGGQVGGMNASLAQTPLGKVAAMENQMNTLKATIGAKLLPIQAKFADWFIKNMPMIEKVMADVFAGIEKAIEFLRPKFEDIKKWIIKAFESKAMEDFKNIIKSVKDTIVSVIEKVIDIASFIKKNWGFISPFVYGIVGAVMALVTAMGIFKLVTVIGTTVTTAMTVAQGALNLVLSLNPIGLLVIAIGALIGVGIALYKNWDNIKIKVGEVWNKFKEFIAGIVEKLPSVNDIVDTVVEKWKTAFEGVKEFLAGIIAYIKENFIEKWKSNWEEAKESVKNVFNSLKEIIKGPINGVIDMINGLIDKLNDLAIKMPSWAPGDLKDKTFSLNIPKIPNLALGSSYTNHGMYEIHDGAHGGEIVGLPNGSHVIPADKSAMLLSKDQGVVVNIQIDGHVIGHKQFVEQVGFEVATKVKNALHNM